ncbi:hypothetical protein C8Q78DRAFT_436267 [Trametes maxima]|nr:hypothetical protein C8Q78DRAFT_436267 [Trametes maxima]
MNTTNTPSAQTNYNYPSRLLLTDNMDTLPLEVLEKIFELACTDGGYTGCSLSLTSRAVRAAASTTRFRSIAMLCRPSRLKAFMALYTRERDSIHGGLLSVAHLHLTIPACVPRYLCLRGDWEDMSRVTIVPWDLGSTNTLGSSVDSLVDLHRRSRLVPRRAAVSLRPLKRWIAQAASKVGRTISRKRCGHSTQSDHQVSFPDLDLDYQEAAQALMHLLSPDLETLVIQPESGSLLPGHLYFLQDPFPRVRELTLVTLTDPNPLLVFPHASTMPLFPALTHLHVGRRRIHGFKVPSIWPAHTPNVTHLRISCLPAPPDSRILSPASADNAWERRARELVVLPSDRERTRSRYLILQPGVVPDDAGVPQPRCILFRGQDDEGPSELTTGTLHQVGQKHRGESVRALVVEPYELDYRDWCARIRDEWIDRVSGGAGCWAELESVIENTRASEW